MTPCLLKAILALALLAVARTMAAAVETPLATAFELPKWETGAKACQEFAKAG
jgi:hypothetical protein